MKQRVCHISYNHQPFDDRIYWKELLTLQEAGYETIHVCVGDEARDFITNEGIRIIQVKRVVSATNIWLMRIKHVLFGKNETIKAIFEVAKNLQAVVYHYHDLQINALAKKLKQLPHQPKVVYDVHEIYWLLVNNETELNFFKYPYRFLYSAAIKNWEIQQTVWCDYIVLTDEFGYEHFKKHVPSVPQTIIYNYSFFEPQSLFNCNKEYDFIYAGQISKTRGVEEVIRACASLKTEFPELKCLLIGTALEEHYLQKLVRMINILEVSKNVILHEAVPFDKIGHYYGLAKIGLGFYYPTKKYSNALAIKLFEYMAFGLPVIFANHGPSAVIIMKENCGLLIDVNHEYEITNAMTKLLSNNSLYEELSKNGIKAVETTYNWKIEKKKLLQIYQSLTNMH
jgi:glycosyltransferase involved in cell wall biosynthesis